jgi:hypothetical protein
VRGGYRRCRKQSKASPQEAVRVAGKQLKHLIISIIVV